MSMFKVCLEMMMKNIDKTAKQNSNLRENYNKIINSLFQFLKKLWK